MGSINIKKLLVLSGDPYNVHPIQKAKEMGYYVITCDYFEDNPGHKIAHESYKIDYTDKKKCYNLQKT